MLFAELAQLGHTGHGAVYVHDFADNACRLESGKTSEVNGSFGLTCADKASAFACANGEDVAWAGEVFGPAIVADRGEDGGGAVACGDTGGSALGCVNGDGEPRAKL